MFCSLTSDLPAAPCPWLLAWHPDAAGTAVQDPPAPAAACTLLALAASCPSVAGTPQLPSTVAPRAGAGAGRAELGRGSGLAGVPLAVNGGRGSGSRSSAVRGGRGSGRRALRLFASSVGLRELGSWGTGWLATFGSWSTGWHLLRVSLSLRAARIWLSANNCFF